MFQFKLRLLFYGAVTSKLARDQLSVFQCLLCFVFDQESVASWRSAPTSVRMCWCRPPPDDIAVCIARAFIIMCVITSYPILHFCGRSVAGLTFHQQTAQDQGRIGCDLFFLRSGWAPEPLAVSEQQLLLTKHKNSRNHISYLLNRKWNVVGLAGDVGRGCLVRKEHFSFQSFPSFSIDKGRIATTTKQIIWTTRFK